MIPNELAGFLHSSTSHRISLASSRNVVVFPDPAGPFSTSSRCLMRPENTSSNQRLTSNTFLLCTASSSRLTGSNRSDQGRASLWSSPAAVAVDFVRGGGRRNLCPPAAACVLAACVLPTLNPFPPPFPLPFPANRRCAAFALPTKLDAAAADDDKISGTSSSSSFSETETGSLTMSSSLPLLPPPPPPIPLPLTGDDDSNGPDGWLR